MDPTTAPFEDESTAISRKLLDQIFGRSSAPEKSFADPILPAMSAVARSFAPDFPARAFDALALDGPASPTASVDNSPQETSFTAQQSLPSAVVEAISRSEQGIDGNNLNSERLTALVAELQQHSSVAMQQKLGDSPFSTTPKSGISYSNGRPGANGKAGQSTKAGYQPFNVESIRADFPALHQTINGYPLVWFDNAATTHKPQSVINAMTHFYSRDYSNIHRAAHTLAARSTDAYEDARDTIRDFINASSSKDIVFVRGTTEGINFIAQTCKGMLREGDEILLTEMEHHANIVPWQLISRETRARIRVIPFNDKGEILLEEYKHLLSPRTKIVSLTHASNTLGTILPVAEMTKMAHHYGAKVVVDGAQSIAHLPVDVRAIGCDYFVFSGHKVFAPTGIGVVYMHPDLHDKVPPWQGGGNMIRRVTFDETVYADAPAKFEAGTPSIGDAVGLGAALKYLRQFDPHAMLQHEHALLEHGTRLLAQIPGVRIYGEAIEKVGVISFTLNGYTTEQVGKEVDRYGIAVRTGHHCAQPSLRHFGLESTVRPSFALYNTHAEVEHFVNVIRHLARKS
jgi:cysteine desulfurase/selenocysteine lyase